MDYDDDDVVDEDDNNDNDNREMAMINWRWLIKAVVDPV